MTSHYLKQWWLVKWHIYASLGLNDQIMILSADVSKPQLYNESNFHCLSSILRYNVTIKRTGYSYAPLKQLRNNTKEWKSTCKKYMNLFQWHHIYNEYQIISYPIDYDYWCYQKIRVHHYYLPIILCIYSNTTRLLAQKLMEWTRYYGMKRIFDWLR